MLIPDLVKFKGCLSRFAYGIRRIQAVWSGYDWKHIEDTWKALILHVFNVSVLCVVAVTGSYRIRLSI